MTKRFQLLFLRPCALSILALICTACSSNKGTTTGNPVVSEDKSSSGAVAEAVGGALSSTSSSGTVSFAKAQSASVSCPTYKTGAGAQCSASGQTLWLDYADCEFSGSSAVFNGTQAVIMSGSQTASCGSFPDPGASQTLTRQYVHGLNSTTPWALEVTSRYATLGIIDDRTANLSNFNGDTLATIVNGGYGTQVGFDSAGRRSSLTLAHRIYISGVYDHTLYGNLTVAEASGATSRTVSGTVTTYHNSLEVIGDSVFNNVVHSDMCCLPISGSITTTFRAGSVGPTALGQLAVGKSETLTFTGCGTATYQSYDGTTQSVALSRCY